MSDRKLLRVQRIDKTNRDLLLKIDESFINDRSVFSTSTGTIALPFERLDRERQIQLSVNTTGQWFAQGGIIPVYISNHAPVLNGLSLAKALDRRD